MPKTSAAICLWRHAHADTSGPDPIEVLIVHPGGPYWRNKDDGAWSLPKGEFDADDESSLQAAQREFHEEVGSPVPGDSFIDLGHTSLKSGKVVYAWGCYGDLDHTTIQSNTFEIEWPPRSGKRAAFPEIDRALWCAPLEAKRRLNPAQAVFVDRLVASLHAEGDL